MGYYAPDPRGCHNLCPQTPETATTSAQRLPQTLPTTLDPKKLPRTETFKLSGTGFMITRNRCKISSRTLILQPWLCLRVKKVKIWLTFLVKLLTDTRDRSVFLIRNRARIPSAPQNFVQNRVKNAPTPTPKGNFLCEGLNRV